MTTNRLAKTDAPQGKRSQHEICDDANARMMADPNGRRDVHWYVHDGQARIGWVRQIGNFAPQTGHVMERDRSRFTAHDWRELSDYLARAGSPFRYQSDGTRYEIGEAA